jgi:hypothetical protein
MRPGVIILGAILIYVLVGLRRPSLAPRSEPRRSRGAMIVAYAAIIAIAEIAILVATQFKFYAALAPVSAAVIAGGFAMLALIRDWSEATSPRRTLDPRHLATFAALILLVPAIGLLGASAAFLTIFLARLARASWTTVFASVAIVLVMQWVMVGQLLERHLDFGWLTPIVRVAGF